MAVGLSGGVDSALAAALLVATGHRVAGLTGLLYAADCQAQRGCCDVEMARALCARLGIEFYPVPLEAEFTRAVVEPFVADYGAGLTPNPCLNCNRDIKFAALWAAAQTLGATALATGHYAVKATRDCRPAIRRAVDSAKDQSYMLALVPPEALAHALFPLGEMTKAEVLSEAGRRQLPFTQRESQDACFVPGTLEEYLSARLPLVPGPIVDATNRVLGEHKGLPLYTIGQRQGLGGGASERLYLLGKDPGANALLVGPRELLVRRELGVGGLNWVSIAAPQPGEALDCLAMIRYRGAPIPATVQMDAAATCRVSLAEHDQAVAPGQGAAFYDAGGWLLGGGVILP